MKLEAAGIEIDIHQRFQGEMRNHPQPERMKLIGSPMHIAVAEALLAQHAPNVELTDDGVPVHLLSLEAYGASFLRHLLEHTPIPDPVLLCSIPEVMIKEYAKSKGYPIHDEEKDDARAFIERIAHVQPQAPFTLLRSAQRLKETFSRQNND